LPFFALIFVNSGIFLSTSQSESFCEVEIYGDSVFQLLAVGKPDFVKYPLSIFD